MMNASVILVNFDRDMNPFSDFCLGGATDLAGLSEPIHVFSVGKASETGASKASKLFGRWPRVFETPEAVLDTIGDVIESELRKNNLVSLLALAREPEQLKQVIATRDAPWAGNNIADRPYIFSMAVLTCGPDHQPDAVSHLLEDANFDALFVLGAKSTSYALSHAHYQSLRFLLDLARDTGDARDRICKNPQVHRLFWIKQSNVPVDDNATLLRHFLVNRLRDYLEPDNKQSLLEEFDKELKQQKTKIDEISGGETSASPIHLDSGHLTERRMPAKRAAALQHLERIRGEVYGNIDNVMSRQLPAEVKRLREQADQSFSDYYKDMKLRPPVVPRGGSSVGIPANVNERIKEILATERDLFQKASALRKRARLQGKPSPLAEIDDKAERNATVERIIRDVPDAGAFNAALEDAQRRAAEFPDNGLSYWVGVLALLFVALVLATHFWAVKSENPGFSLLQQLWSRGREQDLGFGAAAFLATILAGIGMFLFNRSYARIGHAAVSRSLAAVVAPISRLAATASGYVHASRASLYTSELVRILREKREAQSYEDVLSELADMQSSGSELPVETRSHKDALKARLDSVEDSKLLAVEVVRYWRQHFRSAGKWTMAYAQSPDPSIAGAGDVNQAPVQLENTYTHADQAINLIPLIIAKKASPQQIVT